MVIRKATEKDIEKTAKIYDDIHTMEEKGLLQIGWIRGVYPTVETANSAYERQDLFVIEDGGEIVAAAAINKKQVESYKRGHWKYDADDSEVMVLHTLVVSPGFSKKGYGKAFVNFYEQYAAKEKCRFLRMDTNAKNKTARAMYNKLGYAEADIVSCDFNGICGIELVLLEKKL